MRSNSHGSTVYVRGYPESIGKRQIEQVFERFGTLREVKMIKNFAFVSYANQESANAAVEQLHNTTLKGDKLTVEISGKQRPKREPRQIRVKEADKCHSCGKQGHWARNCPQKSNSQRADRPQRRERSRERNSRKRDEKPDRRRRERSRSISSRSSSSSSQSRNSRRRDERRRRSSSSSSSSSSSNGSSSPSSKE